MNNRNMLFFYILFYRGYKALLCHDFKANMQEQKSFQDGKEYNQNQHLSWQIKMKDLKFISTDISDSFLKLFSKYKNLHMLYLQCWLKNGFNGEH